MRASIALFAELGDELRVGNIKGLLANILLLQGRFTDSERVREDSLSTGL